MRHSQSPVKRVYVIRNGKLVEGLVIAASSRTRCLELVDFRGRRIGMAWHSNRQIIEKANN